MPGVTAIASCSCRFDAFVSHGLYLTNLKLKVVAYTSDGSNLVSLLEEDAKKQGLEIIPYPRGDGYRCPNCGKATLSFQNAGHWD